MVNWKNTLYLRDVNTVINYLKNLLGERIDNLESSHDLVKMLKTYNIWHDNGEKKPIPNEILYLASIISTMRKYRNDFSSSIEKKHVINRLVSPEHVRGLFFEFLSIMHFEGLHKSVRYLPNVGSLSESDLRILRYDGHTFYVECTARKPKPIRITNYNIVKSDAKNALRNKANQSVDLKFPRIIAVFFPEEIDLSDSNFREELGRDLQNRFKKPVYELVSALVLVAYRKPELRKREDGLEYYNTDSLSLAYPNFNAKYPLPPHSIKRDGL